MSGKIQRIINQLIIDNKDKDIEYFKELKINIPATWSVSELEFVIKGFEFAIEAHRGANRKGSDIPYIFHPVEAGIIAMNISSDVDVVVAALLHDVVEDTKYTELDIREKFGEKVALLVAFESENKREDRKPEDTWKIRKQETIDGLKNASYEQKVITMGDKLSNIRAMFRDYELIGDKLWERFNQKDKEQHGWYYKSILEQLDELKESDEYKEYSLLCYKLFKK